MQKNTKYVNYRWEYFILSILGNHHEVIRKNKNKNNDNKKHAQNNHKKIQYNKLLGDIFAGTQKQV